MCRLGWELLSFGQNAIILVRLQQFHCVLKNEECSRASSWNYSSSSQTPSENEDDSNANILTCNYHGRHEPRQMDYNLSSDVRFALEDLILICLGFGSLGFDSDECVETHEKNHGKGQAGNQSDGIVTIATEWREWPDGSATIHSSHSMFSPMDLLVKYRGSARVLDGDSRQ